MGGKRGKERKRKERKRQIVHFVPLSTAIIHSISFHPLTTMCEGSVHKFEFLHPLIFITRN